MRQDEAQNLREAVSDLLEVLLEIEVIRQVEFTDASSVAAATEVLEEDRVVEIRNVGTR